MKTLDIFEGNNKVETKGFDEIMYSDGTWGTCYLRLDIKHIVKLETTNTLYDYFLFQNNHGEHTILRNKK